MKISWLGHASFLLETNQGTKIITDPYESGGYGGAVGYGSINVEADIVTVSHQHSDHNYTQGLGEPRIVNKETKVTIKDVEIEGIASYHDEKKGKLRGKNIIFIIKVEGLKIIHFGDLGTKDIDYSRFQNIDIALIPVGGIFTLDAKGATEVLKQINPKITIPMHFKTPKLGFDIEGVDKFLIGKDYERRDSLEVNSQNINSFKKVIVLDYQR